MKLNLLLDNPLGAINGYTNIDPFGNGQDERIVAELVTLDKHVDNAECEELIARNILEYFPNTALSNILHNWLKKIKKGGKFIYEQTDFETVCSEFHLNNINYRQAQELLWGKQDKSWNVKKSGLSLLPMIDFLIGSGFKVLQKRLEGMNFCVVAERL